MDTRLELNDRMKTYCSSFNIAINIVLKRQTYDLNALLISSIILLLLSILKYNEYNEPTSFLIEKHVATIVARPLLPNFRPEKNTKDSHHPSIRKEAAEAL